MPKLWICPHQLLTISETALSLTSLCHSLAGETTPCDDPTCITNLSISVSRRPVRDLPHCILKSKLHLFNALDAENRAYEFTPTRITDAFAGLPLPLCKHTSLSDPKVIKALSSRQIWNEEQRGPLRTSLLIEDVLPRKVFDCASCRKMGALTLYALTTKGRGLFLEVYRDLGPLDDPKCKMWETHAMKGVVCKGLKEAWLNWIEQLEGKRLRWAIEPIVRPNRGWKWAVKLHLWGWLKRENEKTERCDREKTRGSLVSLETIAKEKMNVN